VTTLPAGAHVHAAMNINTWDDQQQGPVPAGRPIDNYQPPVDNSYSYDYDPYAEYYDEEGEEEMPTERELAEVNTKYAIDLI